MTVPIPPDRSAVAATIDHTLLAPTASAGQVLELVLEGRELGVAAVCVSPTRVALAVQHAGDVAVAAVCGFPSGAHRPAVKAAEAALAVQEGAREIDVVIDLGLAADGDWAAVEADLAAVRGAVPPPLLLKVIVESAALSEDDVVLACRAAEAAGADMVKTSTGFHPAGGHTVDAVRLLRATVGDRLGVKASGGIRTAAQALSALDAGASRLGCSATRAILEGLPRALGAA